MLERWTTCFSLGACAFLMAACQAVPSTTAAWDEKPFPWTAALPFVSTPMPLGAPLDAPPPGFVSFCMRFKDQCFSAANEPDILPLNAPTWSELAAINTRVNDAIWPEDDERRYNRAEFWTIPTDGYGDCEDYALT